MKTKVLLSLIFVFALFLRILLIINFPIDALSGDAANFDHIAVELSQGRSLLEVSFLDRAPIYACTLGLIYYFLGHSYFVAQVFQAILGSLIAIIIFYLCRDVFNQKVATISAIIVAIYPVFIGMSKTLLAEPLFTLLLCLSLYSLNKATDTKSTSRMIVSGILMGFTTLTRPCTLFYPVFLIVVLFLIYMNWKKTIIHWLIFTLFMVAVVAPWTYRNYLVYNNFLPVSTNGGFAIWAGSYPPWKGEYLGGDTEPMKTYLSKVTSMKEYVELDKEFYRKGLENIASNPLGYLKLCVRKVPLLFAFSGGGMIGLKPFSDYGIYQPQFWALVLMFLINLSLPILTFLSFLLDRCHWKKRMLIFSIILYSTCLHLASTASPRYNLPVMPLMVMFSVYVIVNYKYFFKCFSYAHVTRKL